MLVSQLDIILGVSSPLTRAAGSTLGQLAAVIQHLIGNAHGAAGAGADGDSWRRRFSARFSHHLPAPLIGVALAILDGPLLRLARKGSRLPFRPAYRRSAPFSCGARTFWSLLPSAVALAFVSSVNILITSRVVEHFRGRHKRMKPADADPELGAYGLANSAASIFGAPLSVGIPARSLAVVRCGGTTPLANLFHAVVPAGDSAARLGLRGAHPHSRAGRRDRLDGPVPARLERLAPPAQNVRLDAAAFLATVFSVLTVNAVLAVAIGCSLYAAHALWVRYSRPGLSEAFDPPPAP